MSMITGCPACGTLFRVVPDQLKISDGWVRCGHCSEVFDATTHLLAAQVAVHDRDRLAVQHLEWKPWLERLCEVAHCKLGPPHRIDAIVIDNSAFSRVRQDTYRLSVTLKNQSAQPVAVPAVELTLTDGQDQPVVRRVLTARELGAPADTLAPASDWSTSLTLAVAPPAGGNRIAGYRLLAFYP